MWFDECEIEEGEMPEVRRIDHSFGSTMRWGYSRLLDAELLRQ